MRKTGIFLSLCAIALLAASLCVNVLLFQKVAKAQAREKRPAEKKNTSAAAKTVKNKSVMPLPASKPVPVVKQKKQAGDLYCTNVSSYYSDSKPVITLAFSDRNIDWESNISFVTITPAVSCQTGWSYSGVELQGNFEPEKTYTIHLKKGLRTRNNNILRYDEAYKVKVPPMPSRLQFVSRGLIYPAGRKDLFLPLELTNVKEFQVRVYKLYENNFTRYLASASSYYWERSQSRFGVLITDKKVKLNTKRNCVVSYKLKLADYIKNCASGIYSVELASAGSGYFSAQRVINLTEFASSAVVDPVMKKVAVAVRSLKDDSPAVNASVTLISSKHQNLASGRTNSEGGVILDYSRSEAGHDKEDSPCYVVVKTASGSISVLSNLSENKHSLATFGNKGHLYSDQIRAFLYAERGIYRPGEKVYLSAFLRNGDRSVCSQVPTVIRVKDSKGNVISVSKVKSSGSGLALARCALPKGMPGGVCIVECLADQLPGSPVWGTTSFLVTDFVPDRIKVQVRKSVDELYRGGKLFFDVNADHYYGSPLEQAPCRFEVIASKASFPAGWNSWSVGDEKAFRKGLNGTVNDRIVKGKKRFAYKGFRACGGEAYSPVLLTACAQVRDPGGRSVTGSDTVIYHPCDYYIGLRSGKDPASRSAVVEWKLLQAGTKALPKQAEKVKVTLSRMEWHYVTRRQGSDIRLDWEQRKVTLKEHSGMLNLTGTQGIWKADLESGHYEIVFSGKSVRTVFSFYHWRGEDSARSANPSVISSYADKKLYKVGETAFISFRSQRKGVVLVTVAAPTLVSMKAYAVQAGENRVPVLIPADCKTSGVYAALTLISGEKRQFGLTCLPVDQSGRKLFVNLEGAAAAVPGGKLNVKVVLKTSDGKPAEGVVQIFAVDEGILALTGYKTPDIFDFFYGRYLCNLDFTDAYSLLYPELKIGNTGRFGGDGVRANAARMKAPSFAAALKDGEEADDDESVKKAAKSAVCVLAPVMVKGSKTVTIDVPDHLGRLRLMAVSSGKTAVGSADKSIVVRSRADIQISGPRACAPGDKAELTFTLLNSDIPSGKGSFSVKLPSGKIVKKVVQIAPGKDLILRLNVDMPSAEGYVVIPCELKLNSISRKKDYYCRVRLPNPVVTHSQLRMLKPGERFAPGKALAGEEFVSVRKSQIALAPSPAAALQDALDFLNDYPYGCLEQTVAAAFPFLAVKDLLASGLITPEMAKGAEGKLKRSAGKVHSMMLYSGAFPMWQGLETPWVGGSIFASHFLQESNTFNYRSRSRNIVFLRSVVSNKSGNRYERAYAAYVLALMSESSGSIHYARALLDPAEDDFASLLAAFALIEANYAGEGTAHLKRLLKKEVFRQGRFPHFTSESSRKGMVLYLLMKYGVESASAEKLALSLTQLLKKDGSGWGMTHANAWAALGLSAFVRENGSAAKGKVVLHGMTGADGKNKVLDVTGNITLPLKKEEMNRLEVENVSNGVVFVQTRVSGLPRKVKDLARGLTIKRVYLDDQGKAVKVAPQGSLLTVELTLTSPGPLKDLVICDMLPGGLEIEDDRLQSRMKMQKKYDTGILHVKHVERLNGKAVISGDLTGKGTARFRYQVRAVTRGRFAAGTVSAEGMYQADTCARTAGDSPVFEVR